MKIKSGFILKTVAGTNIVVAVGERVKTFNSMINLNDTAAFLWKLLEKDTTIDAMVDAMTKEYDIGKEVAKKDIDNFVVKLKQANLLED